MCGDACLPHALGQPRGDPRGTAFTGRRAVRWPGLRKPRGGQTVAERGDPKRTPRAADRTLPSARSGTASALPGVRRGRALPRENRRPSAVAVLCRPPANRSLDQHSGQRGRSWAGAAEALRPRAQALSQPGPARGAGGRPPSAAAGWVTARGRGGPGSRGRRGGTPAIAPPREPREARSGETPRRPARPAPQEPASRRAAAAAPTAAP